MAAAAAAAAAAAGAASGSSSALSSSSGATGMVAPLESRHAARRCLPPPAFAKPSNGELIQLMTKTAMAAAIGSSSSSSKADEGASRYRLGAAAAVFQEEKLLPVCEEIGEWWESSGGRLPSLQRILLEAQWSFRQEIKWLTKEDNCSSEASTATAATTTRTRATTAVEVDEQQEAVIRSGRPSARKRRLALKMRDDAECKDDSQRVRAKKNTRSRKLCRDFVDAYLQLSTPHANISDEEQTLLWDKIQASNELLRAKAIVKLKLGREPSSFEMAEELKLPPRSVNFKLRDGGAAKKQLILANMKLVVSIARQYENKGVDIGDLVQEGTFGLVQAIDKFDVKRGNRFSTYAYWWIFQAMIRTLDRHGKPVRMPLHLSEGIRRINRLKSAVAPAEVSMEEIMEKLKLPRHKVERVIRASNFCYKSASRIIGTCDDDATCLEDFLVDQSADSQPWLVAERMQAMEELHNILNTELEPMERQVILLRFGLDRRRTSPLSGYEIGQSCSLSRERVRKLERSAMTKLRAHRGRLGIDFLLRSRPESLL